MKQLLSTAIVLLISATTLSAENFVQKAKTHINQKCWVTLAQPQGAWFLEGTLIEVLDDCLIFKNKKNIIIVRINSIAYLQYEDANKE